MPTTVLLKEEEGKNKASLTHPKLQLSGNLLVLIWLWQAIKHAAFFPLWHWLHQKKKKMINSFKITHYRS